MGKSTRYKVGQEVKFIFAGSEHTGVIVKILDENKVRIDDNKYTYPIRISNIIQKIK